MAPSLPSISVAAPLSSTMLAGALRAQRLLRLPRLPPPPSPRALCPARSLHASRPALIYPPASVFEQLRASGIARSKRPLGNIFASAAAGGALLSGGGMLVVSVLGNSPALVAAAPGAAALLGGLVFPVGLSMILFTRSDLLTSTMAHILLPYILPPPATPSAAAAAAEPPTPERIGAVLATTFAGNAAGSLVVAAAFATAVSGPAGVFAVAAATTKCSMPFALTFAKGVGANFLVNVAVYMAASAQTAGGKIVSLWMPICAFVAIGLEHSVANMFLLPLAVFVGHDLTMAEVVVSNILPVTLGNFVGAVIFTGIGPLSLSEAALVTATAQLPPSAAPAAALPKSPVPAAKSS